MERADVTEARGERTAPIDILLVGEQTIVREGLRKLFEGEPGFRVVGDAPDADAAAPLTVLFNPDIVIVSLSSRRFPRTLRDLQHVIATRSRARTILMTTTIDRPHVVQAQALGVSGILLRETSAQMLLDSVRSVACGHRWLGTGPVAELAELGSRRRPFQGNRFGLTGREMEVLEGVLRADSNKIIARRLAIAEPTVKQHLSNIFTKVGVVTRLQLAVAARHHGLTGDVGASAGLITTTAA
jgi:two-component system, NarL family, nitrate/nitrite response regulator NarL